MSQRELLGIKLWWKPAQWDVEHSRWRYAATDELAQVEVCIEGDEWPIHLSTWKLGKVWRGVHGGGGVLMVAHKEILRLVQDGTAAGQGTLEISRGHS